MDSVQMMIWVILIWSYIYRWTINDIQCLSAHDMELSVLQQGLPYVYVYYAKCTEYDYNNPTVRLLDKSQFKMEVLKRTIEEQNVDVLVLKLFESVSITI